MLVETSAANYAYGYGGTYMLPVLRHNDVTAGVADGMYVFTPLAQGIINDAAAQATSESAESPLSHTVLLSTTDAAYSMLDYATATVLQQGENDPVGTFDVAVAAENSDTGAKVVWINCANVLLDDINTAVSGGNAQFLGSAVNWLNDAENTAVIESKSMSVETLQVPAMLVLPLGLLFVILLPLVCLLVGAVVSVLRRRR